MQQCMPMPFFYCANRMQIKWQLIMDNSHCGLRGITDNNQFTNALSVRAASMCDITGRSKVKHLTKPDRLNKKKRAEVDLKR